MAYDLISTVNMTSGLGTVFVYVNQVTRGRFINMFLMSIWVIFAFGTYFMQKRTTGSGDFPVSTAIAGFVTAITAVILRMEDGLVEPLTLTICIIMAIVGLAWMFFSKD